MGTFPLTSRPKVPFEVVPPKDAPYFNLYRPKDLNAIEGKLPVVVWGNGGCLRTDEFMVVLYERWAAAGFIVLAIHVSPDGAFQYTADDHNAMVTWVLAEAKKGTDLGNKIDTDRIVAAGNSCGGVTAMNVASRNADVAAVYVLSGSSGIMMSNKPVLDKIKVPVILIVGSEEEDIAGPSAGMDYAGLSQELPVGLVNKVMNGSDHLTLSGDPPTLAKSAEIGLSFMDLALYGTKAALDELMGPGPCKDCAAGEWVLKSRNFDKLVK